LRHGNWNSVLEERFMQFPKVTEDADGLRMTNGKNIFEIGGDAWMYYGSYVLY